MKFGVFLPNGSNGYIPSAASPLYAPTYAHNLAIAREAERQGLDFVLSMMKFRGFGGSTGYWDACCVPGILHPDGGPGRCHHARGTLSIDLDLEPAPGSRRTHGRHHR